MNDSMDYESLTNYYEQEEGYKISRYEITSYVTQRSIDSLLKWISAKKIIIPDFQRDYVWTKNTASKLIDSILLNLPIPNIFLYKTLENGEEKYYVIDGFQRLQTIKFFRNGYWNQHSDIKTNISYKKEDSKVFKLNCKNSDWYNMSYDLLSTNDRFNFDEYSVNLTVFEQTHPEKKDSMFEVFERINTGSEKLSEQEIRNAIYGGEFLKLLKEQAETTVFKNIFEKDKHMSKRQNYIDLYLRFVTYYYLFKNNYQISGEKMNSSKRETLNNFCTLCNNLSIDYTSYLSDIDRAINCIYEFDEKAMYGKKRNNDELSDRIHSVFAEALVIAVIKNGFKINTTPEMFKKEKIQLWNTEEFFNLFVQQTTTPGNISARVDKLLEIINESSK